MKILQVNTVMKGSSTGTIMMDLYKKINESGHEGLVAVGRAPFLEGVKGELIGNKKDFYMHVARNFALGESGFGSTEVTKAFLAYLDELKPDVIHLHNIHGFYLQVEMLFDYIKKRDIPVVWTLHDCWSYTGHCAYYDYAACDKWKSGCRDCIWHAKVYPYALFKDNSVASYRRKKIAFNGVKHMTVVTPSVWLKEQVQQSFLKNYKVRVIYNGIDLNTFHLQENVEKHPLSTLEEGKKVVLGVANIWEQRKGLHYFKKLAYQLSDDYIVKIIGVSKKQKKALEKEFGNRIIAMERTANVEELVEAYQNAHVFVNATLEDNFPTTNIEALACGTPVVTYATGGSGEAVDEHSGIVVRRLDFQALICAVVETCGGKFKPEDCRRRAEKFDKEKRYEEYIQLYESMVAGK